MIAKLSGRTSDIATRKEHLCIYVKIPAAWAEPEVRNCRMAATAGAARACLAATCKKRNRPDLEAIFTPQKFASTRPIEYAIGVHVLSYYIITRKGFPQKENKPKIALGFRRGIRTPCPFDQQ
jgi:hypothetical protein